MINANHIPVVKFHKRKWRKVFYADITVKTVKDYLNEHAETSVKTVVFNVFKDIDYKIYHKII